jgi:Family of unknown function (DUF6314)
MAYIPEQEDALVGYFTGAWSFIRKIFDHKSGQEARVEGAATFNAEGQSLTYAETGTMDFGDYRSEVTQNYIYQFTDLFTASVLFDDQRLFHQLDLKTGQDTVAHWCPPDQYDGHYYLHNQVKWSLNWKIIGPRKNSVISTTYSRVLS